MDEEGDHARVADVTGEFDNRSVMETCMDGQRRNQMLDEDTRYRDGAENIQIGAMSHKASTILQILL
jgi:hypothetical protein